jgi:hypothetical protein
MPSEAKTRTPTQTPQTRKERFSWMAIMKPASLVRGRQAARTRSALDSNHDDNVVVAIHVDGV